MSINKELQYAVLDDLYLDPKNPRLGRHQANANLYQEEVLDVMRNWVLDELAVSYLESGFWTQGALWVVKEELDGKERLVVVEGNRGLATLIYLRRAINGDPISKKWALLVENKNEDDLEELFNRIPYIQIDSRQEIESLVGFRHVTGVKQWSPEQKARYITKLIDEQGMSYEEVRRKIGSYTSTVRHHYISYRLLLQMEDSLEDFSINDAERQFIVMYHLLRTQEVQKYLGINLFADTEAAKTPVPKTRLEALAKFALWLFGNQDQLPLFTDWGRIDHFNKILESPEAVRYLENNKNPSFDYAFQLAHGDESGIVRLLGEASGDVKLALSRAHHYKDSLEIQRAVERLASASKELLNRFPKLREEFLSDD